MYWITFVPIFLPLCISEDILERKPIALQNENETFECYACSGHGCDSVSSLTQIVDCKSKCCYQWTRLIDGGLITERGCTHPHTTCRFFCNQEPFLERNTKLRCESCFPGLCNGDELYPIIRKPVLINTHSILCYECIYCDKIAFDTPKIMCADEKCCYWAILSDHYNQSLFVERGCLKVHRTEICNNTCAHVQKRHKVRHPHGKFHDCSNCGKGAKDTCNFFEIDFRRILVPHDMKPVSIMCYNCMHCDIVVTSTPTIECRHPTCCFSAFLKNADASYYSVRGCASWNPGIPCGDNTCDVLQARHGAVKHYCMACKEGDGNKCNNRRYTTRKYSDDVVRHSMNTSLLPGSIMCFNCTDCTTASNDLPTVPCTSARCCYTALLQDDHTQQYYTIRGCGRANPEQRCLDTCKNLEGDHRWVHPYGTLVKCVPCKRGDSDRCNNDPFDFPTTTTLSSSQFTAINCFECSNCYEVEQDTHTVNCTAASCCYTAHVKNYADHEFYIKRGCGVWDDKNYCKRTCKDVKNEHSWRHPFGQLVSCITCNDSEKNNCNNAYFEVPISTTTSKPGSSLLMCYKCRYCNEVTDTTLKVRCDYPKCCYIVLVTDDKNQNLFAVRGCANETKPCRHTCKQIYNEHLEAHPNGSFGYCMTCNEGESNQCNRNHYIPPKEPTTTITPVGELLCYNCINCNTVSGESETIQCSQPQCCYVALVRDSQYEREFAVRGCHNRINCTRACSQLKRIHRRSHPEGIWHFCITCDESEGHRCNSNSYNIPASN